MEEAAQAASSCFSAAWRSRFSAMVGSCVASGVDGVASAADSTLVAPPCTFTSLPEASRRSRSRRMVDSEVSKARARSDTDTAVLSPTISTIR